MKKDSRTIFSYLMYAVTYRSKFKTDKCVLSFMNEENSTNQARARYNFHLQEPT